MNKSLNVDNFAGRSGVQVLPSSFIEEESEEEDPKHSYQGLYFEDINEN